jgi:hypothetical protein
VSRKKSGIAEALLDAHVRFVLEQLEPGALRARIEREVDAALADAERLRLGEVVTPQAVKETVRIYAVQLELHGGIPELVADIAGRIYRHPVQDRTRLGDLVSDQQLAELLDKLLEMRDLGHKLLEEAVGNPVYSALAGDLVFHGIRDYLVHNKVTGAIPGARAAMKLGKSVMQRATPGLERSLEERLKRFVAKNAQATLAESRRFLLGAFEPAAVREAVLEAWKQIKHEKVSSFRGYLRAADLEDFFVIGYEYWRSLRRSDWYIELIDAGIDGFFERYGGTSLAELLDEIGIERDMLVADAMRFTPGAIAGLERAGMLEPMVRRLLGDFYRSGAVERTLEAGK